MTLRKCAAAAAVCLLLCTGAGFAAELIDPETETVTAETQQTPTLLAAAPKAVPSTHLVTIDEQQVKPQGYNIDGSNYFKLRDIAYLLRGKNHSFDVEWDAARQEIGMNTENDYQIVGGEISWSAQGALTVQPSSVKVLLDGRPVAVSGYNVNGNNYYKIRDIGAAIGFDVSFDSETQTVQIATGEQPEEVPVIEPPVEEAPVYDDIPETPTTPTTPVTPVVQKRTSQLDGTMTVIIDAGHGGSDGGASNESLNLDECHVNLFVAQYLQQYLQAQGVRVIMVRNSLSEGSSLYLRGDVMEANVDTVDLFFSIHHNASNGSARGAQILAQVADEQAGPTKMLAQLLNTEYQALGLTIRPIWFRSGDNGDYYYTNRAAAKLQIPALTSEFCFIDNDEDVQFIDSATDWQREAQAQCNAIMAYFAQVEY